jgi:hypothetical protein
MKEDRSVLRDVIGTAQPEKESKTKKYVRIAIGCVGMVFFVFLTVMAILRRYGG